MATHGQRRAKTDLEKFIENARFAYEIQRMTQKQIAEKAHVTEASVNRMLRGQVPRVSLEFCSQIAHALGFDLCEMFSEPREFMLQFDERKKATHRSCS